MNRASKSALQPGILGLLIAEIGRERFAQGQYTALAFWADAQPFPGLKAWALKAAGEEREHELRFEEYVSDRSQVELSSLPAPTNTFAGYAEALKAALALEQTVTAAINGIYAAAMAAGDPATMSFLNWFVDEQVASEKEIMDLINQVERGAPIDLLDAVLFGD